MLIYQALNIEYELNELNMKITEEKIVLLYIVPCNTVAQIAPCSLMNNPMKASDELNPSSKLYLFFQWFNNAKGPLLVVYTHYSIHYN